MSEQPSHLVGLTDTGWASWRDVVLRSTGFPAESVLALTDPELANLLKVLPSRPLLAGETSSDHSGLRSISGLSSSSMR